MLEPLEQYLTPRRRMEAYTRVILLEAIGVACEKIESVAELSKEEKEKISKRCIARTYWLIEQHPEDRYLIKEASKWAAQLLKVSLVDLINRREVAINCLLYPY